MNAKVTIVIPIYNTKEYLEHCVSSVVNQTFQDIDILLVDDGSTDGSADLCDKLANSDKRIRVIHKENGGLSSVRNLGIDKALGKYLMFLDSDDWLDTETVEILFKKAEIEETDVLRFGFIREFEKKSLVKVNTLLEERLYVGEECDVVCRQILGLVGHELAHPENMNYLAPCWCNFYRTTFLRELGIYFVPIREIGSFEDGFFNFCVFLHVRRFAFIEQPFYHYRKTNKSALTVTYKTDYINRQLLLFNMIKEEIKEAGKRDFFAEAYYNRIALSTMEICFNEMRNKEGFFSRYREIRSVLKNENFKQAYQRLDISSMALKWKCYFFLIKHSMTLPVCVATKIVLLLKNRGTV